MIYGRASGACVGGKVHEPGKDDYEGYGYEKGDQHLR